MILEETFRYFGFFDAIEMGLYFIIVGYYFLLFAYFLTMRFRTSKKLYWLFFSILFLCLAAGRVFFIAYYFFVPEFRSSDADIASNLMLCYRLATLFQWLGIACLMGVLGILLFPPETGVEEPSKSKDESAKIILSERMKLIFRIILIIIPIIIGVLVLFLPDNMLMDPEIKREYNVNIQIITVMGYPIGRFILLILAGIFIFIIPFIFLYLAWKTFGVLRKSYALNAIGFFLYYVGRTLQGTFGVMGWPNFEATVPPLIILSALLIIVIANNYEQLK